MATTSDLIPNQADVIAFLDSGRAFGGIRPRRIDTHVAHVFLTPDRAWKLKRATRFNYLDFSTPEQRRAALETELRLNRRTAPSLYIGVHPVTYDDQGRLSVNGSGPPVDWLLEMHRFPDGALLAELADRQELDDGLFLRLADRIVEFHDCAEINAQRSGGAAFEAVVDGVIAGLADFATLLGQDDIDALGAGLRAALSDHGRLLDERAREGRVRHCHGDLHLANIAMIDGEPVPFDCIEFSEALATIDVLYDLAFPLMDLWRRALRREANILFNRYLDMSAVDEAGVALMPLFLATRAAVRAQVFSAQGNGDAGRSHLRLALALLRPEPARLVAVGGLSGTGKSTVARALGGEIGRAPGARILRSDVLRKRLAGVPPETKLDREWYTARFSRDVYDLLDQRAAMALSAGQSVIADAVFANTAERSAIEALARPLGVPFTGLWLRAGDQDRARRVAHRGPDASDADGGVVEAQSRYSIGELAEWRTIETGGALADTLAAARMALGGQQARRRQREPSGADAG